MLTMKIIKLIAKIIIEVGIEKLPELINALHPEADDKTKNQYHSEVNSIVVRANQEK